MGWTAKLKGCRVRYMKSNWKPVTSSGPQGLILEPILFHVFSYLEGRMVCTLSS